MLLKKHWSTLINEKDNKTDEKLDGDGDLKKFVLEPKRLYKFLIWL